jgi:hypothetical protein
MKKIGQLNVLMAGMILAASVMILSSCGSDDPAPPKASFSYEADGRAVTFTSTSKNAKTFAWDFGDGGTSTEQNPSHTYEAYGNYTVKLKVTGDGGEATSLPDVLTLSKTSDVVIDGNFSEWSDIPASSSLGAGTLTTAKVDYDALNIYFYVEGTSDMQGFFDLYLNVDNNFETAFSTPHWPLGMGAEILIEGDFPADGATLYGFDFSNGNNAQFDFNVDAPVFAAGSGFLTSSAVKTVGDGKGIEFSISRASLSGLVASGFTYGFEDLFEWGKVGSLPASEIETSVSQFVDLTK